MKLLKLLAGLGLILTPLVDAFVVLNNTGHRMIVLVSDKLSVPRQGSHIRRGVDRSFPRQGTFIEMMPDSDSPLSQRHSLGVADEGIYDTGRSMELCPSPDTPSV